MAAAIGEKDLQWPVCLELPDLAVESDCCHQLFCESCAAPIRECPTCRNSPLCVRPSIALRRLDFRRFRFFWKTNHNHIKLCCALDWLVTWLLNASFVARKWSARIATSIYHSVTIGDWSALGPTASFRAQIARRSQSTSQAFTASNSSATTRASFVRIHLKSLGYVTCGRPLLFLCLFCLQQRRKTSHDQSCVNDLYCEWGTPTR